jgi:hypothetical protein
MPVVRYSCCSKFTCDVIRPQGKGSEARSKSAYRRLEGKLLNRIAMRIFSCIFASMLPLICAAQQFSVGFVGGAPAQPPLGTSATKLPFVMAQHCPLAVLPDCPWKLVSSFIGLALQTRATPSTHPTEPSFRGRIDGTHEPLKYRYS